MTNANIAKNVNKLENPVLEDSLRKYFMACNFNDYGFTANATMIVEEAIRQVISQANKPYIKPAEKKAIADLFHMYSSNFLPTCIKEMHKEIAESKVYTYFLWQQYNLMQEREDFAIEEIPAVYKRMLREQKTDSMPKIAQR
ncbi:MAG: hypothetical protein LVQ97_05305 [Candidatus Micrarchaeales archaeon]|jgi:hypothetical protein|uniref:Uncharacterized protein n=1 Tax=Candidatus Micrarchaeum acidiphilum ARMAN-2 TaxID=425595 RepID=C7DG65_MICA2|nr:MAG: hypothetical protein UNLARM2_0069 [Candidatus Micrarchaeum acidiphilum ARMAN-2]MCW6161575.1 hypothetical protein [Candidatus Micrarchaeales archaeon]